DTFLNFLFHQVAENVDFQVRFHWEPNSIAFWDNTMGQYCFYSTKVIEFDHTSLSLTAIFYSGLKLAMHSKLRLMTRLGHKFSIGQSRRRTKSNMQA
ncbi:hypothetical protein P692DRAFT_20732143, partial [Suillus brevipes Sb2]